MATTLRQLDGLPSNPAAMLHDAQNLVITTHSQTLAIDESSHIVTDYGCDIYISNLLVESGDHDHVVNHIQAFSHVYALAVADAYHVHRGDATYASVTYLMSTNSLSPPKLPTVSISANSGERASTVEGGMSLPGVSLEARSGSRMKADLPDMRVSATGAEDISITGDMKLPVMSASGSFAARADSLKLPAMEITASTEAAHYATLDKRLPGVEIVATALQTNLATLDAQLPAVQATITIDAEVWMSLDRNIPPPILSATVTPQHAMGVDALLPALKMVAQGANTSMTLDEKIPPPVMLVAGEGVAGGVIENTARYEDYVLRYTR